MYHICYRVHLCAHLPQTCPSNLVNVFETSLIFNVDILHASTVCIHARAKNTTPSLHKAGMAERKTRSPRLWSAGYIALESNVLCCFCVVFRVLSWCIMVYPSKEFHWSFRDVARFLCVFIYSFREYKPPKPNVDIILARNCRNAQGSVDFHIDQDSRNWHVGRSTNLDSTIHPEWSLPKDHGNDPSSSMWKKLFHLF